MCCRQRGDAGFIAINAVMFRASSKNAVPPPHIEEVVRRTCFRRSVRVNHKKGAMMPEGKNRLRETENDLLWTIPKRRRQVDL